MLSADMVGWEITKRTFVCCGRYAILQATSIGANLTLAAGGEWGCLYGFNTCGPKVDDLKTALACF